MSAALYPTAMGPIQYDAAVDVGVARTRLAGAVAITAIRAGGAHEMAAGSG